MTRFLALALLVSLTAAASYSYLSGGALYLLTRRGDDATQWLESVHAFFASFGVWAPVIYFAIVLIEVIVAPIPGMPVYLAGGWVFGWFLGGTIGLIGNALGAMTACLISRTIGSTRWAQHTKFGDLMVRRGGWVVFLLRVNPLTSTDFVAYAAGLTPIRLWQVGLGTFFGMAPLCFGAAAFSDTLLNRFPNLIYVALVIGAVYAIIAAFVLARFLRRREPACLT